MQVASILRPLLMVVLCASAFPATAQIIDPEFNPSEPIRVVYRVHVGSSASAFAGGFRAPRGTNENLLALTSGAPCISTSPVPGTAWVSMTADRGQALRFAQRHLENRRSMARQAVYIYAIRADATFISVPGAFYSAIDAAREWRAGYAPVHATALEYLLYTRPILGEQAVVSRRVLPTSIISGTPLWIEGNVLMEGVDIPNGSYIAADTEASRVVPDELLPNLLPPNAIASSEAGAQGSCAMSCDRATSASSFSSDDEIDYAAQCSVSDAMSPLLFDIIND
ncbi:hypothetical protein [Noviluteimonas gilva]|uniref:Pertussis toxin subunit 1 n=1 Tax=Noviluteimonas gilva TaxID=2682097 RepID=A0A7C9HLX4_9GAMM|nr:hypothetical protein [Lysobacter gilvus]MUV14057.1 hypothetical protein [Lysobacter gilvus]